MFTHIVFAGSFVLLSIFILIFFKRSYTKKTFQILRKKLHKRLGNDDLFLGSNGKLLRDVDRIIDRMENEYLERKEYIEFRYIQSVVYELILQIISEASKQPGSEEYEGYYAKIFRRFADERMRKGL